MRADDGADLVAVDVDIARANGGRDLRDPRVDAAVQAEGEAVAGRLDLREHGVEIHGLPPLHMENGAEDLVFQAFVRSQLDDGRRHEGPAGGGLATEADFVLLDVRLQPRQRFGVDDGADIGGRVHRVAQPQGRGRAFDHRHDAVGDVVLHVKDAAGRAALTGGAEGGGDDVVGHLLGQGGRVGDHGVDATGFRHQRHDRPVLSCEREVDALRSARRAGEGDTRDERVIHQCLADLDAAGCQHQRVGGHARAVQQRDRLRGDHGRLRCGLGDDGVAGSECGGGLAQEDGEREVPRRDRHEHAAPADAVAVLLAHRAGQRGRAAQPLRFVGVEAQEIDRFAKLRDAVVDRLARFARERRHERGALVLQKVGGATQDPGALRGRTVAPEGKGRLRPTHEVVYPARIERRHGVAQGCCAHVAFDLRELGA